MSTLFLISIVGDILVVSAEAGFIGAALYFARHAHRSSLQRARVHVQIQNHESVSARACGQQCPSHRPPRKKCERSLFDRSRGHYKLFDYHVCHWRGSISML